jgi:hypothetical protein
MVDGGTHESDLGSNAPEDLRRLREHTGGKSFFVGFFMLVVWEVYCKDFFLSRISKKDRVLRRWLELSHGKPKGTMPETNE